MKYEYHILWIDPHKSAMDRCWVLSGEGWELVAFVFRWLILKREMPTVSIPSMWSDDDLKNQPEATLTVSGTDGDSPNFISLELEALRARGHRRVNNPRKQGDK